MLWTSTKYHKNKLANFARLGFAILFLYLIGASGWLSHAQSGRKETQSQDNAEPSKNSRTTKDNKKDKELPTAFIVATAPPTHDHSIAANYHQPPNFEYHARGGCLAELTSIRGAKVIEDEDLDRWEARQTALAEDKAWLIWMELRWDKPTAVNSTQFRLRYLLFEPGTGKIAASGYGNGIRQTWGTDPRRTTLEEQLREAGRDIANQVISDLKSN
jgi:hypothetical protein